jgi:hypothetical protein
MPLLLQLTSLGFTPYPAHAENCRDRLMTDAEVSGKGAETPSLG